MNVFNLIMIAIGIGIGMLIQRLFHILEETSSAAAPQQFGPAKIKKRSLREITSSPTQKLLLSKKSPHRSDRSLLKSEAKIIKKSKSASPALSPAIRPNAKTSNTSDLSSPANVTMSNISPQSSSTEPSMGSTQDITATTKLEVVNPLLALATNIEKLASPRRAVIRPSQVICDCGVELMDDKEKYCEETTMPDSKHPFIFTNKTQILPMTFERYRPLNLIHPPEGPTQLSPFVTMKPETKEKVTLLTPYKPVLHSMYYAHRHALLIGDLLDNYDHLET